MVKVPPPILTVFLSVFLSVIPISAEGNLVQNGDFEEITGNLPGNWHIDTYHRNMKGVRFYVQKGDAFSGDYCAVIENVRPEDSKFIQEVTVKPNTFYKFSCKIKADGIGKYNKGANISIIGVLKTSRDLKETFGRWEEVVFYGRTGPGQRQITVAIRLGGHGKINTGKAFFDDFKQEELSQPPIGVLVQNLFEPERPGRPVRKPSQITAKILFAILWILLFFAAYYFLFNKGSQHKGPLPGTYATYQKVIISKKDYILCGTLTLVYTIMAFINVGSFKAPQTYWKPAIIHEGFAVDLGEPKEIDRVSYFLGLGSGTFAVEFSNDGQNWRCRKDIGNESLYEMMEWRFFSPKIKARYVKIETRTPGVMLNEIGFFSPVSRVPLPIKSIKMVSMIDSRTRGKPQYVFDEQDTIAYYPGYKTGMYFDEVYHARTAYEHLHRIEPTETTHPPLGKLIIAVGIAIFGMSPFGWRFMGTLFGIAMIPFMYMFGLRLFKNSEFAFVTALLMAFDFMHFTQTRIATVDVFAVFFIILMFYFMHTYFTMNFYEEGLKRTLIPLFFSGLFFGLGAASKWIALYGGAGLAIIFFTSLYMRFLEYRMAKRVLNRRRQEESNSNREESKKIVRLFPRHTSITLAWCLLFFIIIPFIIYGLSYIPFMMVPGPGHGIGDVITYQAHMYRYHSRVTDDHPFSSSWWEWPVMKTPIWYYEGQNNIPPGKMSSIVAMGNPAIWWIGILAVAAAIVIVMKRKDRWMFPVLIGIAAQYLPWIVVPRKLTFIYHYFAIVPFMIICIVYILKYIRERTMSPANNYFIYGYLAVVLVLFIMFYPILSGMVVSKAYVASFLRWFKSWIFFS